MSSMWPSSGLWFNTSKADKYSTTTQQTQQSATGTKSKEQLGAEMEGRLKDMQQVTAQLLQQDDPANALASLQGSVEQLEKDYKIKVDITNILKALDRNMLHSVGLGGELDMQKYMTQLPDGTAKQQMQLLLAKSKQAGTDEVLAKALAPFLRVRAKHQYYMYKYVQLNLFVVLYTLKMQQMFALFRDNVTASTVAMQQQNMARINTFVELSEVLSQMQEPDKQQIGEMAELGKMLRGVLDKDQAQMKAQLDKITTPDFGGLIKLLLDNNRLSTDQLQQLITDKKQQGQGQGAASAFGSSSSSQFGRPY